MALVSDNPTLAQQVELYFSTSSKRVFRLQELQQLVRGQAQNWGLNPRRSITGVIDLLLEKTQIRTIRVTSPTYPHFTRYAWTGFSLYELALSLRRRSYISHASALALHGLTDQISRTIYANKEQSPKPAASGRLTQESLDRAFSRKQRASKYLFMHDTSRFLLLSGKHTDELEVHTHLGEYGEQIRVTGIERTLIDIVVRPAYAGGIAQVLDAFSIARDRVSVKLLKTTLQKLEYVYPYHQAIGFLLQRTGYPSADYSQFRDVGFEHDFYLTHDLREPGYNSDWRLFIPKGL